MWRAAPPVKHSRPPSEQPVGAAALPGDDLADDVVQRMVRPVADGLAASYARPGGNVTGLTYPIEQLTGKQLQLLAEARPIYIG